VKLLPDARPLLAPPPRRCTLLDGPGRDRRPLTGPGRSLPAGRPGRVLLAGPGRALPAGRPCSFVAGWPAPVVRCRLAGPVGCCWPARVARCRQSTSPASAILPISSATAARLRTLAPLRTPRRHGSTRLGSHVTAGSLAVLGRRGGPTAIPQGLLPGMANHGVVACERRPALVEARAHQKRSVKPGAQLLLTVFQKIHAQPEAKTVNKTGNAPPHHFY
jgi:hypothetical protein